MYLIKCETSESVRQTTKLKENFVRIVIETIANQSRDGHLLVCEIYVQCTVLRQTIELLRRSISPNVI